MLGRIICGGQTGADQAAWRAAASFGVPTGGWMPKGFLTEDGTRPEFADAYGAAEMPADSALGGTEQNVLNSDGTLWLGETTTAGAQATVGACQRLGKPCLPVHPDSEFEPAHVATWIAENRIRTLNVAGNREGDEPGIGARAERFIVEVLQQLGHPFRGA
jgi:Circularly permutated YpsA SLOG family